MANNLHAGEVGRGSWFGAERSQALNDFWIVYDRSFDAIQVATQKLAEGHEQFGPILRAMSEEQLKTQNDESRELLRRAVAGDWDTYEKNLRSQGVMYAEMGVGFSAWYDIISAFHAELIPRLVEQYGPEPKRLNGALLALQDFLDRAMSIIAEEYLSTKQNLVRVAEAKSQEQRQHAAELEAQNRRIQEANRLKSEFLANMSHELRTPLNSIIGFAEILMSGDIPSSSPQHGEFLSDILTSGRHLLRLINDVLDLAKVEAGKLEFHPEPVQVGAFAKQVTSLLRTSAASRGVRMTVEDDRALGEIFVDPARLKQVLYNYLSNAIKFTAKDGEVILRALPEGDDAFRIEVQDDGAGIAPDQIEKLFTEFQQLESVAAKKGGGTGLGLALTKRLVEAQGGTVGVRSEVGKGSTFWAVLPRRTKKGMVLPAPRVIPSQLPGGRRILVVEDDPRDLALIVQTLTAAGYAVDTASTGAQALERCRQVRFDAVTLDLLLPDISGLQVLAGLRKEGKSKDAKVIVASVVAERSAVGAFPVDDFLSKPIDERHLLETLARIGVTPGRPGHILVVDDDSSSLRLMQATLSPLGFAVVCHQDGASALSAVAQSPPSGVILDLLMPVMDGFEFLARFRAMPNHRNIPVIIWTMKDLSSEEQAQLRQSAQAVVLKGRDGTSALVEEIRALLPPRPLEEVRRVG